MYFLISINVFIYLDNQGFINNHTKIIVNLYSIINNKQNLRNMQSFFECFSCQSKSQSIIVPIKQYRITSKKLTNTKQEQQIISEQGQAPTITTLTFHKNDQIDQIDQIKRKVQILKKKSPSERKTIQSDYIRKNMNNKDSIYYVQKQWSQQYTIYLKDEIKQHMREINNKVLLQGYGLKSGLKDKVDYFLVNKKIWILISGLYGGGPELKKDTHLPMLHLQVSGIKNNKYFCYLNTGLQCLLSIPQLASYFKDKLFRQIKYVTKYEKKQFSEQTFRIIKDFYHRPSQIKDVSDFSDLFQQKFDKRLQHDCQQFIRYYLEMLQDELNPLTNVKSSILKNSQAAYSMYRTTHPSIVDSLFAGQLSNIIKCLNCENISITYDPFLDLTIQTGKNSLEYNLNKYFSQQKLSDLYYCDRCHVKSKATKQLYISKNPTYLLITFKRFIDNKNKISEYISYPEFLNVERYCKGDPTTIGSTQYFLQSIIIHRGKIDKGHYFCITRRNNKWYYINDEEYKQVDLKANMDLQAYMLIYEKSRISFN